VWQTVWLRDRPPVKQLAGALGDDATLAIAQRALGSYLETR
jgi:hypothetical protein